MSITQAKNKQDHTCNGTMVQGRFIICCSNRGHTQEENMGNLYKRVLEIICYRIWALVR